MKPSEIAAKLREVRKAMEGYEDADCTGDPPRMVGNRWMHYAMDLEDMIEDIEERGD